ncbi:hypothetical protein CCAN12_740095 [Capnocytophaga canimorsus]|uniref:Uncharacterized protein n=1 Tax=Capnocytophaga canimorsus TaxID=28188 RepID=A0A0B7HJV8_9FLAO|nr:hypothetical protein CCAN12_740095 [Capnocytophaga canimorsus]
MIVRFLGYILIDFIFQLSFIFARHIIKRSNKDKAKNTFVFVA